MGTDKLRVTIPTPDHSDSSRSTSSSVSRLFILNCGPLRIRCRHWPCVTRKAWAGRMLAREVAAYSVNLRTVANGLSAECLRS